MRVSLHSYNSLSIDAYAEALDHVENEGQLKISLEQAESLQQSVFILGAGTNVVFSNDIPSRVIRVCSRGIHLLGSSGDEIHIRAYAGENWHEFVLWTLKNKCYGLENLALIPGSVGAAPIQNIGAFGAEIASFISKVNCMRIADGKQITLDASQCRFGYRDSIFKKDEFDRLVVLSVDFVLSRVGRPIITYPSLIQLINQTGIAKTPEGVLDAVIQLRKKRLPDPVEVPNAGSFFKNPIVDQSLADALCVKFPELPANQLDNNKVKLSAGWLIEQCGWKGYQENGAAVYQEHALVIINTGGATGDSILNLAHKIKSTVRNKFDIELEIEPRIVRSKK